MKIPLSTCWFTLHARTHHKCMFVRQVISTPYSPFCLENAEWWLAGTQKASIQLLFEAEAAVTAVEQADPLPPPGGVGAPRSAQQASIGPLKMYWPEITPIPAATAMLINRSPPVPEFRNRPRWKNAMVFLHDEHEDVSLFAEDVCKLAIVRKQSFFCVISPAPPPPHLYYLYCTACGLYGHTYFTVRAPPSLCVGVLEQIDMPQTCVSLSLPGFFVCLSRLIFSNFPT